MHPDKWLRTHLPLACLCLLALIWLSISAIKDAPCSTGLPRVGMRVTARHISLRRDAATRAYQYFPQALSCQATWQEQYARMHDEIRTGERPPRFLISVSVESGLADRITGMVTQLFVAMLGSRAFTAITYGGLPRLESVCDSHYINWTHPTPLAEDVIAPLKTNHRGSRKYDSGTVDNNTYAPFFTYNNNFQEPWQSGNMSLVPDGRFEIPYVVSASNRGHTYTLANNAIHKSDFWKMGLHPHDAFMCGFFFMCMPKRVLVDQYRHIWDRLSAPNTFIIAINVRIGDWVFGSQDHNATKQQALLDQAKGLFDCASKVEQAFATPGKRVLWYVSSDSLYLRRAAAKSYGQKIITDTDRASVHVDCMTVNLNGCERDATQRALVHALGDILTFSMADYHIMRANSGFGRVGGWLSGRWNNLYEIQDGQTCDPGRPTPRSASSVTWSGI